MKVTTLKDLEKEKGKDAFGSAIKEAKKDLIKSEKIFKKEHK